MTRILAAILLLSPLTALADDFGTLPSAAAVSVPPAAAPTSVAMEKSRAGAEMGDFFRKLESIGLDTSEIRKVSGMVSVVFSDQWFGAAAEYGYIMDKLYIPYSYKAPGGSGVKFALSPDLIDTLVHEYVHAALDVYASGAAQPGTPAREQYDAVSAIQADLRSQALYYRYARMKADEVSAYFIGASIADVFSTADDIVFYNTKLQGAKAGSEAEAIALGGRLILPSDPDNGFAGLGRNKIFGRASVYDIAQFKDNKFSQSGYVRWPERQFIKDSMYKNILGLKPPRDTQELLQRLNAIDNPWIREVRATVAKNRLQSAQQPASGKTK